ncbi:MAG TPA: RNA 2',3'-cyclic phosphodiesterase [Syntrophus sp. (in: bacteria)]|jgi:2'-5' RNA ligase|nr:RNA 2',3'-cyclic phosphodiesterase [Syntrophus sp. (in: bacteria)]
MSENKNIRSFLAIDPPGGVLENIQAMQNRLKRNIQGVIRWVRPEGIHLTLKFFGDISEQDVADISEVIARRTNAIPPFALEVGGLGAFPDAIRPRIIWLGITGHLEQLLSLQKDLEEGFFSLGFPKDDRTFRAHLTMGRVKVPKGIIGLDTAVDAGGKLTAGTFTVGEVALFQSSLSPQGATYTRLAVFPLRGDKL